MTELLKITPVIDKSIRLHEFKDKFSGMCKYLFHDKKGEDLIPMALLLTATGKLVSAFPNFNDDTIKSKSIAQMKIFAKSIGCQAFGLVTEGYGKKISLSDNKEMQFIKDLDHKISLLPSREEVLFCYMEIRDGNKIKVHGVRWQIINKHTLGPMQILDGLSTGKMSNILS